MYSCPEELVFITSEDIILSISKYNNAYPDPYLDLDTVLSFILEDCICQTINKLNAEPDLMMMADAINSRMIEFIDAECQSVPNEVEFNSNYQVIMDNLEKKYNDMLKDGKLKFYLFDIIKAVYEEVCNLKLPKSKANILEYVARVNFNGMGILAHLINNIN